MHLHSNLQNTARRGNTIVLVTSILVLLVIIATAFVGRTRATRDVSAAQQSSAGRDGRGESVGVAVANEIADALFSKPVNTSDPFARTDASANPPVIVASSSWPRLAPQPDAERYSIDRDVLPVAGPTNPVSGDGFPDFGYNFAPYEVKPWTNWPDDFTVAGSPWPQGRGAPAGQLSIPALNLPIGSSNPYGNPGFGDTRWLRSTEPERVRIPGASGTEVFEFSHWSHLSWLPSAENGWRVVTDISNVEANTLVNLNEGNPAQPFATAIPYEQWLPGVVPNFQSTPAWVNANFAARRSAWFGAFNGPNNYASAYRNPNLALPNFFSLKALGLQQDEFRANTPRNLVSRTFSDTDGDGFTDSFWFLAPTPVDRGTRTLVGVSIVDNSALLNANVATKFSFTNTVGATPSDLALVSSRELYLPNVSTDTVGFLDGPLNQAASQAGTTNFPTFWNPFVVFPKGVMRFERDRFGDALNGVAGPIDFLKAIGLRANNATPTSGFDPGLPGYPLVDPTLDPALPRGTFESPRERAAYYKMAGLSPDMPLGGLTPFDAADEFELRAYHGNNSPLVFSRFEQALSFYNPGLQGFDANSFQMLRASPMRVESTEVLDQLSSQQLLLDNRRKLTLFSGARNDLAPASLWPSPFYEETTSYTGETVPAVGTAAWNDFQTRNYAAWDRGRFKLDLRESMLITDPVVGAVEPNVDPVRALRWRSDLFNLMSRTMLGFHNETINNNNYLVTESYFGTGIQLATQADYSQKFAWHKELQTEAMIGSYIANLEAFIDEPGELPSGATVLANDTPDPIGAGDPPSGVARITTSGDPAIPGQAFAIGVEPQPFLMEVFFGLCYPKTYLRSSDRVLINQALTTPLREDQADDFGDYLNETGGAASGGTFPRIVNPQNTQQDNAFVSRLSRPAVVLAIQVGNPYPVPVSLAGFRLRFYDRYYTFPAQELAPATLAGPSTAIVYAVSDVFGPFTNTNGTYAAANNHPQNPAFTALTPAQQAQAASAAQTQNALFRRAILDFLDIEIEDGTIANLDEDGDGLNEFATLYDSFGVAPDVNPLDRTIVLDGTAAMGFQQPILMQLSVPPASTGTPSPTLVSDSFSEFTDWQDGFEGRPALELERQFGGVGATSWVVVDRMEYASTRPELDRALSGDPAIQLSDDRAPNFVIERNQTFAQAVEEHLFQRNLPPAHHVEVVAQAGQAFRTRVDGIRLPRDHDFFFTWVRMARPWAMDVDAFARDASGNPVALQIPLSNRRIGSDELSPRFVFAATTAVQGPTQEIDTVVNQVDNAEVRGSSFVWERTGNFEYGDAATVAAPFTASGSYAQAPYSASLHIAGQQTDPDGTFGNADFWARMQFRDVFGRLVEGKPVTLSNVLYLQPSNDPSIPIRNAIYSRPNGRSMPFLPKYNLPPTPNAQSFVWVQPWHNVVNDALRTGGEDIEFVVGGKGFATRTLNGGNLPQEDLLRLWQVDALRIPFQLPFKNGDIEQVGEMLEPMMWGHIVGNRPEIPFPATFGPGAQARHAAIQTLSETLVENDPARLFYPGPAGPFLNRLNFDYDRPLYPTGQATYVPMLGSVLGKPYRYDEAGEIEVDPAYVPWKPSLPPGLAFLDGVTVDGPGRAAVNRNFDEVVAGEPAPRTVSQDEFNAWIERFAGVAALKSQTGRGALTSGLININTALPETLHALPLMTRLPRPVPPGGQSAQPTPYVRIPTAIDAYRDGQALGATGTFEAFPNPQFADAFYPTYADRGIFQEQIENAGLAGIFPVGYQNPALVAPKRPLEGLRGDGGFATASEMLLLTRTPTNATASGLAEQGARNSFSIRAMGLDLYDRNPLVRPGVGASEGDWAAAYAAAYDQEDFLNRTFAYWFGTDRSTGRIFAFPEDPVKMTLAYGADPAIVAQLPRKYEKPAGDAEDLNMLFKGVSNLVTTRSDVFTVYLRVRQVRPNPITGIYDGSNLENIVDDTRYVMCVDRSEVNKPGDQPKIVYFQKVPE